MTGVAASNIVATIVGEQSGDALDEWNGAKKQMNRWSVQDVFCCYNAFETFVASL